MSREELVRHVAELLEPASFRDGHPDCPLCRRTRDSALMRADQFIDIVKAELAKAR